MCSHERVQQKLVIQFRIAHQLYQNTIWLFLCISFVCIFSYQPFLGFMVPLQNLILCCQTCQNDPILKIWIKRFRFHLLWMLKNVYEVIFVIPLKFSWLNHFVTNRLNIAKSITIAFIYRKKGETSSRLLLFQSKGLTGQKQLT